MDKINIAQEIIWTEQEIADDDALEGTRDFSNFHKERLAENRIKLQDLQDKLE